jgi:hypothetical protein
MLLRSYTAFPLRFRNIPGSSSTRARIQDVVSYFYVYEITNFYWFNLGSHRRQLNTNDAVHDNPWDVIASFHRVRDA